MTTNPIQPLKGNRDDAASRSNAPTGNQGQSAQAAPYSTPKQGQSATGRDEGSRSFRSGSEAGSQSQGQSTGQSQSRDGGSAEVLRCLDTIEENCRKVRTALSASGSSSSRDGTKQATERQSNEGGPRPSRTEDAEDAGLSSDRNRNLSNDI